MIFERHMGLDIGTARIGVAFSDPLGIAAHPHSTVDRNGNGEMKSIVALIEQQKVQTVVIGVPYELDGNVGDAARGVLAWGDSLRRVLSRSERTTNVKIEYWDERLTTASAEHYIVGSRKKNKDRRSLLDQVAASLILESYMSCKGKLSSVTSYTSGQ